MFACVCVCVPVFVCVLTYLTHFYKLLVISCGNDDVSVFSSEALNEMERQHWPEWMHTNTHTPQGNIVIIIVELAEKVVIRSAFFFFHFLAANYIIHWEKTFNQ